MKQRQMLRQIKENGISRSKNSADQMIHTAERALKDAEGKISDDIKNEVTQKRIDLTSIKNNPDSTIEAIKKATEELSESMMKIGEAMKTAMIMRMQDKILILIQINQILIMMIMN